MKTGFKNLRTGTEAKFRPLVDALLRSSGGVIKITTRAIKIGVQLRFYPISTVGFRTFSPENLAKPSLVKHEFIRSDVRHQEASFTIGILTFIWLWFQVKI